MSMMAPIRGGIRGAIRGGIRGGGASYLIAPGFISPAFTFTRAQAGGAQATALASDGATVQYYAADIPRFTREPRRLLIEGQRTAISLQSTDLTAAPWTQFAAGGGATIALSNVAVTAPDGGSTVTKFDIDRINTTQYAVRAQLRAVALGYYPRGIWVKAVAAGDVGKVVDFNQFDTAAKNQINITLTAAWQLVPGAVVSQLAAGNPTVLQAGYQDGSGAGQLGPVSFYAWGASVQDGGASDTRYSTLVPTTTVALTRGRDVAPALLTALGVTGQPWTITGVAMFPQAAPASIDQTLDSVDDASDTNRITLRNAAGGSSLVLRRVTAGVGADSVSLGNMVAGTPFRYAIINDGAGGAQALLEGGSWQSVAGAPTALTTMRLGSLVTAGSEMFGERGRWLITAGALSQSAAAARMASIPLT